MFAHPEAITEKWASPPALAHYYNRHCTVFMPPSRPAADNDLAPALPLLQANLRGKNGSKTCILRPLKALNYSNFQASLRGIRPQTLKEFERLDYSNLSRNCPPFVGLNSWV
jgi:hypothetical protein